MLHIGKFKCVKLKIFTLAVFAFECSRTKTDKICIANNFTNSTISARLGFTGVLKSKIEFN